MRGEAETLRAQLNACCLQRDGLQIALGAARRRLNAIPDDDDESIVFLRDELLALLAPSASPTPAGSQ